MLTSKFCNLIAASLGLYSCVPEEFDVLVSFIVHVPSAFDSPNISLSNGIHSLHHLLREFLGAFLIFLLDNWVSGMWLGRCSRKSVKSPFLR